MEPQLAGPPPSPAFDVPVGGECQWGPLTEEMLRQDAARARELRDKHRKAARVLAACGWGLCLVGACAAAACVVCQAAISEKAQALTTVLVAVSGACNALQRVPGPGSLADRYYDLALRADQALARCVTLLDAPPGTRPKDPFSTLASINQQIDSAHLPGSGSK